MCTLSLWENIEQSRNWWFIIVLIFTVMVTIGVCEGFNKQVQLSWWGVLFSCSLAFFFTLPIGIIKATTNQVWCVYIIRILLICIGLISYLITNDAEAWSKHYFRIYFRVYFTVHTSGQRLLQDLQWRYNEPSSHFSSRFQAGPLHEDSSTDYVYHSSKK